MSKLSERCEQRKQEAEALAEKYNAGVKEVEKLNTDNQQVYAEFQIKNAQLEIDGLNESITENYNKYS